MTRPCSLLAARSLLILALAPLVDFGCVTGEQRDDSAEQQLAKAGGVDRSAPHGQPSADADAAAAPEPGPSSSTKDAFAEAFVAAHDRHRAEVSPPAEPPLPPVRWSVELAAAAEVWARRCEFEHSDTKHGENLSARTDETDPAAIVGAWAAEAQDYDYQRDRCAEGAVCGHYTQVVWRDSTTIGCGKARCSGGGPFGEREWFMWVCNYSPPGNYRGQRPY